MAEKDYEVGYGRPPKHSRFKPGKSGNPCGRPKGAKNVDTVLRETLSKTVTVTENGRRKTITWLEAIMLRLFRAAVEGDPKATAHILKLLPLIQVVLSPETAEGGAAASSASHFIGAEDLEILKLFANEIASGGLSLDGIGEETS